PCTACARLFPYTTLFRSRKLLEIAQRRVAGAEVVDRQPAAQVAQLACEFDRRSLVADQRALGEFEHESVRRHAPGVERLRNDDRDRKSTRLNSSHVKISY